MNIQIARELSEQIGSVTDDVPTLLFALGLVLQDINCKGESDLLFRLANDFRPLEQGETHPSIIKLWHMPIGLYVPISENDLVWLHRITCRTALTEAEFDTWGKLLGLYNFTVETYKITFGNYEKE